MTKSKEIKKSLKEAGIDTRFISVTHKWCGYSESYRVEICSTDIDKDMVKRICNRFKEIDRDEITGEILEGGNTYIWVDYCWEIRKKLYEYDRMTA